jgi:hypothetical protein
MLKALYLLFGVLVIGGYGYSSWRGLELVKPKKQQLAPGGVRGATAGGVYYRGGYRGGK